MRSSLVGLLLVAFVFGARSAEAQGQEVRFVRRNGALGSTIELPAAWQINAALTPAEQARADALLLLLKGEPSSARAGDAVLLLRASDATDAVRVNVTYLSSPNATVESFDQWNVLDVMNHRTSMCASLSQSIAAAGGRQGLCHASIDTIGNHIVAVTDFDRIDPDAPPRHVWLVQRPVRGGIVTMTLSAPWVEARAQEETLRRVWRSVALPQGLGGT